MSSPPLADQAARERIEHDLEATLFVEAAAGTGKTTALVRRIVSVLAAGRGTLEDIVAVTFTEKAAGEMKLRLRAAIEEARAGTISPDGQASPDGALSPDARQNLDAALEQLELAHIGTIHGFCADLLKERPIEAGVDPGFTVAAEDEAGRILDRAFESWFQRTLADPPEGVRRALRRRYGRDSGGPRGALRRAVVGLAEHRDFGAAWRRPEGFDREAELDRAVDLVRDLARLAGRAANERDYLTQHLRILERWVEELDLREEVHGRDHDGLEASLRSLVRYRPERKGWTWRGFRDEWFGEGLAKADVLARRDGVRAELEGIVNVADADLAALLREELRPVIDDYEELKRKEGKLDFVDLLLRVRDLLRDDDATRAHYQRRFSHFFVDEFQDTDPLQVEILLLLCATDPDERAWASVRPAPGKLFLVGDPKQSIYRFRRADVMLYEATKRRLAEAGAEILLLTTSFRSQPRIQETVNAAFALRMTGSEDGSQAEYVPLSPFREDLDAQPAVLALPVPRPYAPWGKVTKRSIDESLPDAVGAFVDWLVNESGWKVTERDRPEAAVALEERHVCLLFRRFQSWGDDVTRPYVRALEAREIPHVLVGGRSYFDREEVLAVRNCLTAIEWPDDVLSVYAALKGPIFSLGDDALLGFKHEVGALHPLRPFGEHAPLGGATAEEVRSALAAMTDAGVPPELRAVAEALAILGRLHRKRNRRPISETITRLLAAVRAHAGIAIWPTGEQALANVLRLVDRSREFERHGAPSFRAFLDRLEEEAERGQAEEAPIVEEGTEGVRIMTVHKAKGLEFPVVIACDMTCNATWETPGRHVDPARRLWAEPLCGAAPLDLLDALELESRREMAEADRLAYVAATRARDLVVVPALGDGREDWEGRDWWLDALNPAIYPALERRRAPESSPYERVAGFGDETVLERGEERGRPKPRPESSVAPGAHRAAADSEVVWWDPASLDLEREAPTAERQQRLLEVDEEAQRRLTAEAGIQAFHEWRNRHEATLADGSEPQIRVVTVSELAKAAASEVELDPVIRAALPSLDDVPVDVVEIPRPEGENLPHGDRFGSLVHLILASIPLDAGADAIAALAELEGRGIGAPDPETAAAEAVVTRALLHPLIERAAAAERRGALHREIPAYRAAGNRVVIEGRADLAFREEDLDGGGRWTVIDFKTDRRLAVERAVEQVRHYVVAVSRATGEPASGVVLAL